MIVSIKVRGTDRVIPLNEEIAFGLEDIIVIGNEAFKVIERRFHIANTVLHQTEPVCNLICLSGKIDIPES
ncbi:MAG: hypothetical protein WCQ47_08990 [bacterium]